MRTDKYLRLDGKPRGENGIRIIAESPGAIPDSVAEQVFADMYGVTDAEVEENGRRMVASWNACRDIPTDTLEAGVVVVPVETVQTLLNTLGYIEGQLGYIRQRHPDDPAWSAVFNDFTFHVNPALSHLQQNGGEGL